MFTSSTASNLAQTTHNHPHFHLHQQLDHQTSSQHQLPSINQSSQHLNSSNNNNANQHLSTFIGQNFGGSFLNQQNGLPSQQHLVGQPTNTTTTTTTSSVPQFFDANQHLATHFNQQSTATSLTAVTGGHFVEGLGMTNATQFVSVLHHQESNPQLHQSTGVDGGDGCGGAGIASGGFNAVTFFQQHHSSSNPQHHHQHHQHLPTNIHSTHNQMASHQQIACANATTNATRLDNLTSFAGGNVEQLIGTDEAGASLIRLQTGVVGSAGRNPASIVVNTINELRHHHERQQTRANAVNNKCHNNQNDFNAGLNAITIATTTINNITNNNNHNDNDVSRIANITASSNFTATNKLAPNNIIINNNNTTNYNNNNNELISSSHNNDSIHTSNNSRNSNKSKSNGNSKRDKIEAQRNSESPRRTFACPTCGKGFTEKFNMKRHMQIHSQSRPKYVCHECSKSFAWKDNFIRHKKAAHGTSLT